ncbi:MAG: hypothetical protein V1746_00405 [bacterium]
MKKYFGGAELREMLQAPSRDLEMRQREPEKPEALMAFRWCRMETELGIKWPPKDEDMLSIITWLKEQGVEIETTLPEYTGEHSQESREIERRKIA